MSTFAGRAAKQEPFPVASSCKGAISTATRAIERKPATQCKPINAGRYPVTPSEFSAQACDRMPLDVMKIGDIAGLPSAMRPARPPSIPVTSHLFIESSAEVLAVRLAWPRVGRGGRDTHFCFLCAASHSGVIWLANLCFTILTGRVLN